MYKFWLAALLVLMMAKPVYGVEFTIYDAMVSGLDISLTASLSSSSNYYLQGLLRSQSSSKYFGETQNTRGDWVDYVSSPEKEYIVSNFYLTEIKDSTWSGQLRVRFKLDDPNYLGPGVYDFKLRRFTGNSTSSAGESNTIQLNLTVPQPTPTPSPSPTSTPTPTPPATPNPSPSPTPTPTPTKTPAPSVAVISSPQIGTVAGESTEIDLTGFGISPTPASTSLPEDSRQAPTLNKTRAKTALLVGSGLIILSVAGYFAYRKYHSVYNQET